MADNLATIQQEVVDRLLEDAWFDGLSVVPEDLKDIENEVERAVAQIGLSIVVATVTADVSEPNLEGPYFDDIRILVRIAENVVVNRGATGSQKTAGEVAVKVSALLHHWTPAALSCPLLPGRPTIVLTEPAEGLTGRDVLFTTQGGAFHEVPQVATPVVADEGGQVTITCATAGAAIYYTVNGLSPNNVSGTLYTGAFAAEVGDVIRARAYLVGKLKSEVGTGTVTTEEVVDDFDPVTDLSDKLRLWLDPTRQGLTAEANAASLTDYSPNAVHHTQGTTGAQPLVKAITNGEASFQAVLFDGVDDVYDMGSVAAFRPAATVADASFSLFLVFAVLGDQGGQTAIWAHTPYTSNFLGGMRLWVSNPANFFQADNALQFDAVVQTTLRTFIPAGTYHASNPWGWHILEIRNVVGGSCMVYLDGVAVGGVMIPTGQPTSPSSYDTAAEFYGSNPLWMLGAQPNGSGNPANFYKGYLAAVGYFDALTDEERADVLASLKTRFGIA